MLLLVQERAFHLSVISACIALRQVVCCSFSSRSALILGLLENFLKLLAEVLRLRQTLYTIGLS